MGAPPIPAKTFTTIYPTRVDKIRETVYWVIEEPGVGRWSPKLAAPTRIVSVLILSMTILSLVAFVFESMPEFADTPVEVWRAIEVVTTVAFTVEYLMRMWVCSVFGTSGIAWCFRPMNLCDLLALSPLYVEVVFVGDFKFLHMLRVIRLFKLARYSRRMSIMSTALMDSFSALQLLVLIFCVAMVTFGSAVYFAERHACPNFEGGPFDAGTLDAFFEYSAECSRGSVSNTYGTCCDYACRGITAALMPNASACRYDWGVGWVPDDEDNSQEGWEARAVHDRDFASALDAMWWSAVTMATVGYGDVTPRSPVSKLIACAAMLTGMLAIAMPFAIVGTKFSEAVAMVEDAKKHSGRLYPSESPRRWTSWPPRFTKAPGGRAAEAPGRLRPGTRDLDERLTDIHAKMRRSMELKRKIQQLQVLRDNLWTSAEHCMADLTLAALIHFDDSMLTENPVEVAARKRAQIELEKESPEWSCGIFHRNARIRRFAIFVTKAWWFDWFILIAIFANSLILASQVYTPIPDDDEHWGRRLQDSTENIFLAIFGIESIMKAIAQGFVFHPKSYMRDPWNWIDFSVVVSGVMVLALSMTSNAKMPTGIRTIRMLRPLRTLTVSPNMRKLVNTVLNSLPGLKNVTIMALFLLVTFGILGIQFWGGKMHRLCRVTPQPLHFIAAASQDATCKGWCFDNSSVVVIDGQQVNSTYVFDAFCRPYSKCLASYTAGSDYYTWPIEPTQDRLCGAYQCRRRSSDDWDEWSFGLMPEDLFTYVLEPLGVDRTVEGASGALSAPTWCGSALSDDRSMSPAATNSDLEGIDLSDWEDELFSESFNWGITHYDHLLGAFLVIFQCVTLEGWVDIMYMLQDADSQMLGFAYFCLLIVLGSFFLLNITLAVVWDSFNRVQISSEAALMAARERATILARRDDSVFFGEGGVEDVGEEFRSTPGCKRRIWGRRVAWKFENQVQFARRPLKDILKEEHRWRVVVLARAICRSAAFDGGILLIISLNVVLLAYDQYPEPNLPDVDHAVRVLGICFNMIFLLECVIYHVALGPLAYWLNTTLLFDGIVVVLSVWEMLSLAITGSAGSGFAVFRAFRLLRIMKLARKVKSMRMLLKAGVAALLAMQQFVVLLLLIISVFALMGQGFFGGKFLLDPDTGLMVPEGHYEQRCGEASPNGGDVGRRSDCIPRAHFDTFLWSSTTIFQILTGEDWNTVMYDAIKAVGWPYMFFFVAVVLFGNFVILNLFLAILMLHFSNIHHDLQNSMLQMNRELSQVTSILGAMRRPSLHTPSGVSSSCVGRVELDSNGGGVNSRALNSFERLDAMAAEAERAEEPDIIWPSASMQHDDLVRRVDTDISAWAGPRDELELDGSRNFVQFAEMAGPPGTVPGDDLELSQVLPVGDAGPSDGSHPYPRLNSFTTADLNIEDVCSAEPVEHSSDLGSTAGEVPKLDHVMSNVPRPEEKPAQDHHGGGSVFATLISATADRNMIGELSLRVDNESSCSSQSINLNYNFYQHFQTAMKRFTAGHFCHYCDGCFCGFRRERFPRAQCISVVEYEWFESMILVFIVLSSATMSVSNPLRDPNSTRERCAKSADLVFSIVFAVEVVLKIIAWGFLCDYADGERYRPAYLKTSWNRLDFLIVTTSVVDVIQNELGDSFSSHVLPIIKVLRIARLLRPLRIIARNDNLKVVVRTIGDSLDELRNLMLYSSLFYVIFGLLGVAFFKGSFYHCVDSDLEAMRFNAEVVTTPLCIPHPGGGAYDPGSLDSMMFASEADLQGTAPECPPAEATRSWESWQRPTADTPICEVHCEGDSSDPFCELNHPWGYHIMRCGDCQSHFCPDAHSADAGHVQGCEELCKDHVRFCQDGNPFCVEQCVAQCLCDRSCSGLSEDAALCTEQGGRWLNLNQNFDNLGSGMMSLFEISTTEGWVDTMLAAVDSRNPMQQPRRDENELAIIIFVAFILIGSFFVLNICVGVIIDNYARQKNRGRRSDLTELQQKWVYYQKVLFSKRHFFLVTQTNRLSPTRQHLLRIVGSSTFESVVMVCILLNTVLLGSVWHPTHGDWHQRIASTLDGVFALLFNLEAAMKLLALRRQYFSDYWNVFDFFCVFVSDVMLGLGLIVGDVEDSSIGRAISVLRIFRIARLFRLVRFLKGLNQIFFAFILTMPKLLNVSCVMFLLIYVYTILGVNMFATVAYIPGSSYNEQANFRSMMSAGSLLVRSMTGEGWNSVMHDLSRSKFFFESYAGTSCVEDMGITKENFREKYDLDGDGWVDDDAVFQCGTPVAVLFYFTYTLMVTFIFLNLFIAVIFEGFEEAQSSKLEIEGLIQTCVATWGHYDPSYQLSIPLTKAFEFVDEVMKHLCKVHEKERDRPVVFISRWDAECRGAPIDTSLWSLHNLFYIRMLALTANRRHQVRFPVAVKAVIRGMLCFGGLNDTNTTHWQRHEILRSLEEIDRQVYQPDSEFEELLWLESKQLRRFGPLLNAEPKLYKIKGKSQLSQSSWKRAWSRVSRAPERDLLIYTIDEYRLNEQVAAAKIQRRIRENRRLRNGRKRPSS